jgi:hypothetical protein
LRRVVRQRPLPLPNQIQMNHMKTYLFSALAAALILPSCASSDVARNSAPGQPMAIDRAERKIYATPTPVSEDPTSPLYHVESNGSAASVALASF